MVGPLMASWKGIALGAAGLAVADAVLSSSTGASRLGTFGTTVAKGVNYFLSVTTPGLKTPAKKASSTTATTPTSSGGTTTTASARSNTSVATQNAG